MHENIDLILENQTLKTEFAIRNLDLSQVFYPTPEDLERENRHLADLLDWVQKWTESGDRKSMEKQGYMYPPIEPGISPDDDWYLFVRWINGKPTRMKIKDYILPYFVPKKLEHLSDDEIHKEIEKFVEQLERNHIGLDLNDNIPLPLIYRHLLEIMEDEFEVISTGCWHLDGCTGFCPDCFQRPWCDAGGDGCWQEDEAVGEMALIDAVKQYVSPSPVSLRILQARQAEHDREFAEFEAHPPDLGDFIEPLPSDFDDSDDDLPF
ncbi:hypothetical protein JW960_06995 [candidate division KSB1 bacterium]|nr:hypothetical protein [candidate division KSB1 bacterium]